MSEETAVERARYVAESACDDSECSMCAEYIATGNKALRPTSREGYLAGLARSYPNGIPTWVLPAADRAEAGQ